MRDTALSPVTRKLSLNRETVRVLTAAPVGRAFHTGYCASAQMECNTDNCQTVASVFMSCETFPTTTVTEAGCVN